MPTHMAEKYSKDDLNDSYRVGLIAINLLRRQAKKDSIGQFLSQDEIPPLGEKTLEEFYGAYEVAASIAAKLGVDEGLTREQQQVLANFLYRDYRRRDYYTRTITRFAHVLSNPEEEQEEQAKRATIKRKLEPYPLTFVELEQRYQWYSQRKARRRQELGLGPTFENWCLTEDCPKPEELFRED